MQKGSRKHVARKPQRQQRPGSEARMIPAPLSVDKGTTGSGRLRDRVALITGGDSGIGRAVAIAFAREGADVAIVYKNEHVDAHETERLVVEQGRRCLLLPLDVARRNNALKAVDRTVKGLGGLHVLVNNAAVHYPQERLVGISEERLLETFRINVFSAFFFAQAASPHLRAGASVINTTSVTAYRGSAHLVDYAATKGALVSFTRSLAAQWMDRGIRVNAVAPGPVWTPLIASSFPARQVAVFGTDAPMGRAGEPEEIAPCFVFLASEESSYMSGQVLHPNGGEVVNG